MADDPRSTVDQDLMALWRRRTWAAHIERLAANGVGAAHRAVVRRGDVVGVDLGVPYPWGVQITSGATLPDPRDAADALAWAADRPGARGWRVSVPPACVGQGPWSGLPVVDEIPAYAMDAADAAAMELTVPDGVRIVLDPTHAQVVSAYGGWMDDPMLAGLLCVPEDLTRSERSFVVAIVGDDPVGCAFVWWVGDTGYLSGIGVRSEHRGVGIGRALTVAAAHVAATGPAPDLVWMHATDEGAALYARLGFTRIDVEVMLGPAAAGD